MAKHNLLGKRGEDKAVKLLLGWGFVIQARNWRHSYWEIDIIASKGDVLHFIEVKTRSSTNMGFPEDGVNEKKLENLLNASDFFCEKHPQWKMIQFDILSILLLKEREEYLFIEDVFI
ncbi:MAG: YraN family protein [Chitinophagaceae bacterium]|mgnify:CR=1 FL=1|nr:YraN family protein [Bacteroidota bacterium]MCC6257507.1 YraN family protein [Chitinophagaceae bacterium]MCW5916247.1 YraN family protein [Ferruginibacter sp.]